MPRYIVTDKVPCWVTYAYHVEADTSEEAIKAYHDGEGEMVAPELGPEIGDTIGMIASVQEALKL